MAVVVSRIERFMQYASAAIFLSSLVISWVASSYGHSHPAIYPFPQTDNGNPGPILAVGLVLLIVGLPVALAIFSSTQVAFVLFSLVFLPIAFSAVKDISNVSLGGEEVTRLNATVIGKRQSGGWKTHAYLLQVTQGEGRQAYEFAVDYKYFLATSVGDGITLNIRPGYFGQPWVSSYGNVAKPKMLGGSYFSRSANFALTLTTLGATTNWQ
jgi:hypothetical protein